VIDNDKKEETLDPASEETELQAETGEEAGKDTDGSEGDADDGEVETEETVLEQENADLKDKLLRSLADMENLRRRSQKDREDALKYSATNFARDILSVADNLRRAIESIPEEGDPDGVALAGFIEGIDLTERELLSTLDRHGIRKIEPTGEKFDPQFHEAMFEIPTSEAENGIVMQVVEVGYVIHDRLLRPARVGIAKAEIGNSNEPSDDE
tara:strand:+ start:9506 stop:10141 length:636 start_codon:yes stop_codon:yes gene_type:complete